MTAETRPIDFAPADQIAQAVLYEGHVLYPYRSSAVKNRRRFNFGVLAPQASASARGGDEAWSMQTECLVWGDEETILEVRVRFLHPLLREVQEALDQTDFRPVEMLEVDGRLFQTWQETMERELRAPAVALGELIRRPPSFEFSFAADRQVEPLRDASARLKGSIVRRQAAVAGRYELQVEEQSLPGSSFSPRLYKVGVRIMNLTPVTETEPADRHEASLPGLVSTHTLLGVRGGEFVSLLDPPAELQAAAAACRNVGTWPVLVGREAEKELMLSSPIILYDYPQIAPESAGDLFDGTEIDEILTLRILTLTEEEKREMRSLDERTRRILERTEALPVEQLQKLHGAIRGLRPSEEESS